MRLTEGGDKPVKQEELDPLLTPIALHPDSLLAQIFMASTYPLEVVQAQRWAKANQNLKGDALSAAQAMKRFDPDSTWKKVESEHPPSLKGRVGVKNYCHSPAFAGSHGLTTAGRT